MDSGEATADGVIIGTSGDEKQTRNGLFDMGIDRAGGHCGDRSGWRGDLGNGLERGQVGNHNINR